MQSDHPAPAPISTIRAVRHHLALVTLLLVLGVAAGCVYFASAPVTYSSTASVLVNPSNGNPYSATPSSVRQDEVTSMETEAQVASSADVLASVADDTSLSLDELESGVQVVIPPNTQVAQISFTAADPAVAQRVTDALADAYLANRDRRFDEVNQARIERVETRTRSVVADLRAATKAAQTSSPSQRLFQKQLADAFSNELVSLRSQRTALENSETPGGSVVSPASSPASSHGPTALAIPVGGALAGLALGCLLAVVLERLKGRVRSAADVEATGLPVIAAVPRRSRRDRLFRRDFSAAVDNTIRRVRASILDRDPRPDIVAIAPAGSGSSDAVVSEAVAESFAKAGHRVVLVQTDGPPAPGGLAVEEKGLAHALLHDRLTVLDMLQPSVDPLLCLLPEGGFDDQSRELLVADRLRTVLNPLVEAGNLVVIQSPGIDSAEGEAIVGAADLGLVVVTMDRTRSRQVEQVTTQTRTRGTALAALVVRRSATPRARRAAGHSTRHQTVDADSKREGSARKDTRARVGR
jgi:polysaccharide biosynthesis transport protein